jgi:hypothetical protein
MCLFRPSLGKNRDFLFIVDADPSKNERQRNSAKEKKGIFLLNVQE